MNINGLDKIISTYLYSNNSNYLFLHFSTDDNVIKLSQMHSFDYLISELKKRLGMEASLENIAIAYAILHGIYIQNIGLAKKSLRAIDLSKLEWANDIEQLFDVTYKPSTFSEYEVKKYSNFEIFESDEIIKNDNNISSDSNSIYNWLDEEKQ